MSENFNYKLVNSSNDWEEFLNTADYDECIDCNSFNIETEIYTNKLDSKFKVFAHCMECGRIIEIVQVLRI